MDFRLTVLRHHVAAARAALDEGRLDLVHDTLDAMTALLSPTPQLIQQPDEDDGPPFAPELVNAVEPSEAAPMVVDLPVHLSRLPDEINIRD